MTRHPRAVVLSAALALLPGLARASDVAESGARQGPVITTVPVLAQAESAPQAKEEPASPSSEPPATAPPPAPSKVSPPPAQESPPTSVPPGQWVYTAQYGWIWMPYAETYTYVPPSGYGAPYMYVYYPFYGWSWVVAPWVWGFGPWPYFGFYGAAHFAWYGHGYWRYPARWHYAPGYRGGYPYYGAVRPYHGGARPYVGGVRPAPRPGFGAVPSRTMGPAPSRGGVAGPPSRGGVAGPGVRAAPAAPRR